MTALAYCSDGEAGRTPPAKVIRKEANLTNL